MDEVASPKFIVENKKVLQAHVDGAILGQSSTQLFTYDVFLCLTPLMLTTNNYDCSKFSASDINRIETNAVAVCINEPVFEPVPAHPVFIAAAGRRVSGSPVTKKPR